VEPYRNLKTFSKDPTTSTFSASAYNLMAGVAGAFEISVLTTLMLEAEESSYS
jgi:hypothetical protein